MRIRRIHLAAILATATAVAPILAAVIASSSSPPRLSADNIHVNVDYHIPNVNAVDPIVPDVPVPNINAIANPGHVGLPGRGR